MPRTSVWWSGPARTNASGGGTVAVAGGGSATSGGDFHNTRSCRKRPWYALSSSWGTVVRLRPGQISARSVPAPSSVCWRKPVVAPRTSIVCSWSGWKSRPRRSSWMSTTGGCKATQEDARYQDALFVHYPSHPHIGQDSLPVVRRTGSRRVEYIEVRRDRDRPAVPVWMIDPQHCAQMTCGLLPACAWASLLQLAHWLRPLDFSRRS